MKETAASIINAIEGMGVHDKGLKCAHARGVHYQGEVQLNKQGEALFGERKQALIRLSDAPPNKRHAPWMIPLKGLSIYLEGESPVNLIFVTFPYFPWVKAASVKMLATYFHAMTATNDWQVRLNLINKALHVENFYQHLGTFLRHQPISVLREHRNYYNPHYYKTAEDYVQFDVHYNHETIELFAVYYTSPAPISKLRHDGKRIKIGEIQLQQQIKESRPYFEVLDVGPYLTPLADDEILHLRHEMYLISNARRQAETRK